VTQCQNCKAQLSGPYCAQCGQKHNPKIPSVLNFLGEFTEAFTHADSRLWRTLGLLLVPRGYRVDQLRLLVTQDSLQG